MIISNNLVNPVTRLIQELYNGISTAIFICSGKLKIWHRIDNKDSTQRFKILADMTLIYFFLFFTI